MVSVDRIEDGVAVLEMEDGSFCHVPLSELPAQLCEGDMLEFTDGEYRIRRDASDARRAAILALQDSLFDD